MYTKLNDERVIAGRRVAKVLYPLDERRRKIMCMGPVDHIFSRGFVTEFSELSQTRPLREFDRLLACIRRACRYGRIASFERALSFSYDEWAGTDGMGDKTMALLLDILTAFGFEIKGAPALTARKQPRTATELARSVRD